MRFGVEIELDSLDGRDFSERPLAPGEMPKGCDLVSDVVSNLGLDIQVHGWRHNHNNSVWVCKPDSSCGIELCSPVLEESRIDEALAVLDALNSRSEITAGPNCAFHVHVDVSPLVAESPTCSEPLCSVLAWWVKCEPVLMDSVPARRRNSRFCRCIGFTDLFDHDERVVPLMAVTKLREKYLSVNTTHLVARKRNSIEFRILEGTKDPSLAGDWIRFVLNFVRNAAAAGMPGDYRWVSFDETRSLVDSHARSEWLRGRILQNAHDAPSRFWRSRSRGEVFSPRGGNVFGRTSPSGIGPQRDK